MHCIYCKGVRINPTTIYSVLVIISALQPGADQQPWHYKSQHAGILGAVVSRLLDSHSSQTMVFILLLIILPHTTFLSLQLGCFFLFFIFHYYLVLSTKSIIKTSTQSTPPGLYANLAHGVSTLDRLCYIEQHHQAAMFSRDATYTLTG